MAIKDWYGVTPMVQCSWTCGHCGMIVAANMGFYKGKSNPQKIHMAGMPVGFQQPYIPPLDAEAITSELSRILICPNCEKPTLFEGGKQMPGVAYGAEVGHLPDDVSGLYKEARNCVAVSAFTASVLATRKLFMNVAVSVGAAPGGTFQSYVIYLASNGYVPPNASGWIDHIRNKGNEATHEIPAIAEADAKDLLTFMEMILKLIFEFPNRIPIAPNAES